MAVRRVLLAAPLLLAVLVAVLAGCGGGDDSVADPPISSAPTSSPTTQERETPEQFIRRWANAEKAMENTGDTAEYLALSHGCKACRQLADKVHDYYAAGGFVHWGG